MILAIVCRVGMAPVVEGFVSKDGGCIDDLQRICGGLVDVVAMPDGCDVWLNEDFLMRGIDLPVNRVLDFNGMALPIRGDFVICRVGPGGTTVSATPEDLVRYAKRFADEDTIAAHAMNAARVEVNQ